jgi:predicted PurR-regulated permease PerM
MKKLFGEAPLRILAFLFLLAMLAAAFFVVRILLVPFVAAMFVVYLFDPVVVGLQRRGFERGPAFLLVLSLSLIAIGAMLAFMPSWLRLESISGSNESFVERFTAQLNALEVWINTRFPMFGSIKIASEVTAQSAAMASRFVQGLPGFVTSFIINLLLVPFIAYFMIRDGKSLKRRVVELVPNRYFEMSLIMISRIDQQIGGYLRGRLIECILVGITQALLMGIATVFARQQNILLIAAVCGATNIIPYVGPVLGTAFGVFLYVGSGLPMSSVLALLAAAAAAHLIDNVLIAPAVLSHNVDLHPLTVALVLVIGGEMLGTLGLLIAIPVASSIKVITQEFYGNYQLHVKT